MNRRFAQVDVFTTTALSGNPLAVVIDAEGLSDNDMARFARWTNLSETTFLLPPEHPDADYRVRIFTTSGELPFAGHPTLGTCAVWLSNGGRPAAERIVQECGVGRVPLQRDGDRLAFSAPPLIRSGPVDDEDVARIARCLGTEVLDAAWADNGPGWLAVEVADIQTLRQLTPDFTSLPDVKLGVIAHCEPHDTDLIEVRAFYPSAAAHLEDPVTGSLNASVAQWLMERNPNLNGFTARQGLALQRAGRVHIDRDSEGTIWVGGSVTPVISGTVDL